jgi:hydroxypyruvate isomerase
MSLCLEPLFPTENMAEKISRLSSLGFKHFEFWSSEDKDWEWLHRHRDEFSVQLFSAQREHTCYIENHQNKYIDEIIGNIKKAKKINCHKLMLLMDPLEKNGHVK